MDAERVREALIKVLNACGTTMRANHIEIVADRVMAELAAVPEVAGGAALEKEERGAVVAVLLDYVKFHTLPCSCAHHRALEKLAAQRADAPVPARTKLKASEVKAAIRWAYGPAWTDVGGKLSDDDIAVLTDRLNIELSVPDAPVQAGVRPTCKQCNREIERCLGKHDCEGWVHVNGGHFCIDENANTTCFKARPAGPAASDGALREGLMEALNLLDDTLEPAAKRGWKTLLDRLRALADRAALPSGEGTK
jgi:hypothetical protein